MNILASIAQARFTLLDRPLIDGIAYFAGAMQGFFRIAFFLSLAFGAAGIVWTSLRLCFGSQEVRKALVGLLVNFLLFTVLTASYPRLVNGVLELSLRIGMAAGDGYFKINSAFLALKNDSEARQRTARETIGKMLKGAGDIALSEDDFKKLASSSALSEDELRKILKENEVKIYSGEEYRNAGRFGNDQSFFALFNNAFFPSQEQQALKVARDNFNKNVKKGVADTLKDKDLAQAMVTMKALDEVLSEVEDPGNGDKVKKYLYDPFLRDERGASLGILSPGAMIKTSVLIADIINRQGSYSYDTEKKNFIEQTLDTIKNIPQLVSSLILKALMTFGIIIAGIFFVLQYCVCIIEYYIVAASGLLLIPCILFEGTKDFAKKLVGLFASYFVKIIVMSLAVFWAYSAFISMGNDIIGSNQPISFLSFSNFIFTAALSWIVVREAPKIAQGLFSGSPSLTMGDFTRAAGSALAASRIAGGAVKTAIGAPGAAVRGVKNIAGKVNAVKNGFSSTVNGIKERLASPKGTQESPTLYGAKLTFTDGEQSRAFPGGFSQDGEKNTGGRNGTAGRASLYPAPGSAVPPLLPPFPSGEKESSPPSPPALTAAKNSASSRANAESMGKVSPAS
jgi:type IV secretion system protein TrbL